MVFMVTRLGIVFNVIERRGRTVLAVLCMAQFVAVLDANALIVALPQIGRELRMAGDSLQWVDHGLRRRLRGVSCWRRGGSPTRSGASGCSSPGSRSSPRRRWRARLAPTSATLIAARALQGLGAALLAPAALALLPKDGVAVWTATAAVGGASGLMVGGLLAGTLGWRWVFLINVPIGLVTLALAARLVPEARGERKPLDLRGAALATTGLAAIVYALAEHRWLLLALAFVPLAFVLERPKRPAVAGSVLTAALLTAATSGGAVLATLELQTHLGPFGAGLHLLPL